MKLLSLATISLLSVSSLIGMNDQEVLIKELKTIEELSKTFSSIHLVRARNLQSGLSLADIRSKDIELAVRRKRYIDNGALQNFDFSCFAPMEKRLYAHVKEPDLEVVLKGTNVNKPDLGGILPLQHALQQGHFNLATQILNGCYEGTPRPRAQVKLNFLQKDKNPFVKTLIDSVNNSIQTFAHASGKEKIEGKSMEAYLEMTGAILLNQLLQNGASTDYHGANLENLEKYACKKGLSDLAELIKLAREKNEAAMNELVLMIKDETMCICQENK